MIPAMRLTCLRRESSKRSTGVALDFRIGSPSRRMKDMAATRRASASGSSGGASSSSDGSGASASCSASSAQELVALCLGALPFLGHRGRV